MQPILYLIPSKTNQEWRACLCLEVGQEQIWPFCKSHLKGNHWHFDNIALISIMDLRMNYIFWKFEAGKVQEYGVIWQPPFSASMAYKPQILIWIWFCTFNGYLKIFAIQPWRTDIKILTSAFATSATSVSYTHMKGKDWYLRKNVNISILLHIKISIFWNFEFNLS